MLLHEQVLPALLVLAVVLWLVAWLHVADPRPGGGLSRPGRVILAAATSLAVYVAAGPWLESSGALLSVAFGAARASGWLLNAIGVPTTTAGNILHSQHADVVVTTECVVTPLMPVFLAVALTLPATWGRRAWAVAGFVPLFGTLIVARLLTVALPPVVGGTPLVLTHAFHQIVLGVVTVMLMRWWAAGTPGLGRCDQNRRRLRGRGADIPGSPRYGASLGSGADRLAPPGSRARPTDAPAPGRHSGCRVPVALFCMRADGGPVDRSGIGGMARRRDLGDRARRCSHWLDCRAVRARRAHGRRSAYHLDAGRGSRRTSFRRARHTLPA
jgi:hypothetical protein